MPLRHASNIDARLLFMDALSGEFTPQCDSEKRHQTLGRLAFDAFEKGEEVVPSSDDPFLWIVNYRPSWASHILVRAQCDMRYNRPLLDAISLRDQSDRSLLIADATPHHPLYVADTRQSIDISTKDSDITIPVPLGEAATVRGRITAAAQHFFDRSTESAVGY